MLGFIHTSRPHIHKHSPPFVVLHSPFWYESKYRPNFDIFANFLNEQPPQRPKALDGQGQIFLDGLSPIHHRGYNASIHPCSLTLQPLFSYLYPPPPYSYKPSNNAPHPPPTTTKPPTTDTPLPTTEAPSTNSPPPQ